MKRKELFDIKKIIESNLHPSSDCCLLNAFAKFSLPSIGKQVF